MNIKGLIDRIFKTLYGKPVEQQSSVQNGFSREQLASHEAAHGIIWYLFRAHWIVNSLSIERDGLPDPTMHGALHISPKFDVINQSTVQRENELVAIAYAGLIGQNIDLILKDDMITIKLFRTSDINTVFNTSGCSGDFALARRNINKLAGHFGVIPRTFEDFRIADLITLFTEHSFVQAIHNKLSNLLLTKGTINREELTSFFEESAFADYIENEALDTSFFHTNNA